MRLPRDPLTLLLIGAALGGILGAVIGVAIGSTAGRSSPTPPQALTVFTTQTIRVPTPSPPTKPVRRTTTTSTTDRNPSATDTTTVDTTTTDTTSGTLDTTPTPTRTPTTTDTTLSTPTDTLTTPGDPNRIAPANPFSPPRGFCKSHVCAVDFSTGTGYAVQCADGVWTRTGGQVGACRADGGVA